LVLGRGGMSIVYRAFDVRLNRKVALKLLAPELAEDARFRERFLRESQLAASLDHPNVVPVYEAGDLEGLLYIAMRYVAGTDLKAVLRAETRLAPERALALVAQVGDALDAAHRRGLVHRDVKPSNILVTGQPGDEHCYLADFGLSTSASDRSAVADPRQILGTIDYVAPEQIRDGEIDGRADIYSLACLLFELVTGDVPFRRPSDVAVIYAHLEEPPPTASGRGRSLPVALDSVLQRGMAKRPEDRWNSCADLVDAARLALAGGVVPAGRRRGRRRLGAAGAVLVAVSAAGVALLLSGGGVGVARADSLVRIDVGSGRANRGLVVAGEPTAITVCGGSVWITTRAGTVTEVDPRTLTTHTIRVRGTPSDVADVGDLAAVVSGPPAQVTIVDAGFGQISDRVALPEAGAAATAVAFGRDVWVANPRGRTLDLLDPPYTAVADSVRLPGSPGLVAAGAGAVWAVGGRTLWRVDAGRRRLVASLVLPFVPKAIAAGDGGVWLVDSRRDVLVRVDPAGRRTTDEIRVGRGPVAVAVGAAAVWVANRGDGTVSRIDPVRAAVVDTIRVGQEPVDVVAGLGAVWVARRTS
jgi:serine/threonine-protein kinase